MTIFDQNIDQLQTQYDHLVVLICNSFCSKMNDYYENKCDTIYVDTSHNPQPSPRIRAWQMLDCIFTPTSSINKRDLLGRLRIILMKKGEFCTTISLNLCHA